MQFEDKFIGKTVFLNGKDIGKCVDMVNIMYLGQIIETDNRFYVLAQGDTLELK